jgi:uncharacterized membrane protein YhaH (DUF805 family)
MKYLKFLFSFKGRVRRGLWWAAHIPIIAVFWSMILTLGQNEETWRILHPQMETNFDIFMLATTAIMGVIVFSFSVRRAHDLGMSGWFTLLTFVPGIGLLFNVVVLGMIPGNKGANEHGSPPGDPEAASSPTEAVVS